MEFAPWHTFRRLVTKYRGDFNVRRFRYLDQFLCMAFAQLTHRESLRDIEGCLRSRPAKLSIIHLPSHHLHSTIPHNALVYFQVHFGDHRPRAPRNVQKRTISKRLPARPVQCECGQDIGRLSRRFGILH